MLTMFLRILMLMISFFVIPIASIQAIAVIYKADMFSHAVFISLACFTIWVEVVMQDFKKLKECRVSL